MDNFNLLLANEVPGIGAAGQRVTLALQPADVHEASEMPTYLAGYKPFGYRADEASKVILVDKDTDKYRTFHSDDAFRRVPVTGTVEGAPSEVDPKSSTATYKVVERFVGAFISRQTQDQPTNLGYNPLMAAGRRCRRALDLDREVELFTLIGTNTNWDSSVRTALAATYGWNGGANGDPIKDLQDSIELSWQPVTEIWMNETVAHAFLRHDAVRDHMRQMLGDSSPGGAIQTVGSMSQSVDFQIPGLPAIRVAKAKYKVEATGLLAYCLGNVVALVSSPPGQPTDGEEVAASYTFRRRGPSGTGFEVREYEVPGRGSLGGTMVVVTQADDPVMTGSKAGAIITGVIE